MTGTHEELTESLRFQLSLLRLATVPHNPTRRAERVTDAAQELAKLAEKVPVGSRHRTTA